jgi:hypothetical protein
MKKVFKLLGIIALVAVIGFSMIACDSGGGGGGGGGGGDPGIQNPGGDPQLSGSITISPNTGVITGTELTANYSGSETVSFQWKKGSTNVGTNSNKYTPAEAGSYTVTVRATGYTSKTSAAVAVTDPSLLTLSGSITISPSTGVNINTELTANYSGSEPVSYQWKKDGVDIGTNSNKYTPTAAGSYTVTVSAAGYNSKTSAIVDVNDPSLSNLSGTITITNNDGTLTATYTGSEEVTYQWNKDGEPIPGATSSTYTPTENGSYTVTVSKPGYNHKTSDPVIVNNISGNAGVNWTAVTNSTFGTNTISAIAWGNGKFVAGVLDYGKMAYSADGITWTAVANSTFPSYRSINAIAYGNDKFVAVGGGDTYGKMAYSVDGITWTAVTITIFDDTYNNSINAIAYGNGKFVAGGGRGQMAYSTDGVNWTAVTNSAFGTSNIMAIAWGNGKFGAVGRDNKMAYSTDGITWTAVTDSKINATGDQIDSIAWGNGKFVAGATGVGVIMAYSADGVNWTAISNTYNIIGTTAIRAIAWGGGKFVAGGTQGKMAYSADGASWTAVANSTFGTSTITAIAWGGGKFVAGGIDGKMAYSGN